jgi:hypothetical protein
LSKTFFLVSRCLDLHIKSFTMSAAPASGATPPTTKATTSDKTADSTKDAKPAAALEEDDEFEDFPVESMLPISPLGPMCSGMANTKLKLTIA